MQMTENLDCGSIYMSDEILIGENETFSELSVRLAKLGGKLLIKTLKQIENGEAKLMSQDENLSSYAPILTREIEKINFNLDATKVHKLICGLSDKPGAYCKFKGKILKIYRSEVLKGVNGRAGELIFDGQLIVGCFKNSIRIIELQIEGKKRIKAKDFLNGNVVKAGDFLSWLIY